jgi:hypothetical protein
MTYVFELKLAACVVLWLMTGTLFYHGWGRGSAHSLRRAHCVVMLALLMLVTMMMRTWGGGGSSR